MTFLFYQKGDKKPLSEKNTGIKGGGKETTVLTTLTLYYSILETAYILVSSCLLSGRH